MSVVRRGERRAARNVHSSPYTRPAPPKKSVSPESRRARHTYLTSFSPKSWSLSGLLNYILPIRPRPPLPEPAKVSEEPPERQTSPAATFSARGHHVCVLFSPLSSLPMTRLPFIANARFEFRDPHLDSTDFCHSSGRFAVPVLQHADYPI
jgi:hypothetical protein